MDPLEEYYKNINEGEAQQSALIQSMLDAKEKQIAEKEMIIRYKQVLAIVKHTPNHMLLGQKIDKLLKKEAHEYKG